MQTTEAKNNPSAFTNLFNLYTYELALTADHSLGTFINENGQYIPPFSLDDYFNGKKEAWLIRENGKAIGFITFVNNDANHTYLLEEAFLIFPYRNNGYVSSLLNEYLHNKTGIFQSHILKKSTESQKWFENFISSRNLSYKKESMDELAYIYTVNL